MTQCQRYITHAARTGEGSLHIPLSNEQFPCAGWRARLLSWSIVGDQSFHGLVYLSRPTVDPSSLGSLSARDEPLVVLGDEPRALPPMTAIATMSFVSDNGGIELPKEPGGSDAIYMLNVDIMQLGGGGVPPVNWTFTYHIEFMPWPMPVTL